MSSRSSLVKANATLEKRLMDEFNYTETRLDEIRSRSRELCNTRDRFLINKEILVKARRLSDSQKVMFINGMIEFLCNGVRDGELPEIEDPVAEFMFQDFVEDFEKSSYEYYPKTHNSKLLQEMGYAKKMKGGKGPGRPKKRKFTYQQAADFLHKYHSNSMLGEIFKKQGDDWLLIDESDNKDDSNMLKFS